MAKKLIKIKNKRFTIHEVPQPSEAVDDLIALGFRKPYRDSIALTHFLGQKIILQEDLNGKLQNGVKNLMKERIGN